MGLVSRPQQPFGKPLEMDFNASDTGMEPVADQGNP
jgi:hypothetical protein